MSKNSFRAAEQYQGSLCTWQRSRSSEELQSFIKRREALMRACIGCDEVF